MNKLWLINAAPLIVLLPMLVVCAIKTVRPKIPLYFQITFGAAACACLEFIYYNVLLLCATEEFRSGCMKSLSGLGSLAVGGFCAFFFAANFGQFDSFVDGGQRIYRRVRLISLAAPAVILGGALWALISSGRHEPILILIAAINLTCMVPCSYYNLKFILMKDDGTGFVSGARLPNIASLLYIVLELASAVLYLIGEQITEAAFFPIVDKVLYFLTAAVVGVVFVSSAEGRKKWMSLS